MSDKNTPEAIAKKRILDLHQRAQINARDTGGDPAEATFELLVAACLLAGDMLESRRDVYDLMEKTLAPAVRCAENWFPDISQEKLQ